MTVKEEPRTEELTIYQASRREVVFDVAHGAFSAAFEALLGRTDVGGAAPTPTKNSSQLRGLRSPSGRLKPPKEEYEI